MSSSGVGKRASVAGEVAPAGVDAPLRALEGIGPARAAALARIGLERVRDLLLLVPRRIESSGEELECARAAQALGRRVIVSGRIGKVAHQRFGRRSSLRFPLGDESGELEVCFFNQPWLRERFVAGERCRLSGVVVATRRGPALVSPRVAETGARAEAGRWIPVLPRVDGLGPEHLAALRARALERFGPALEEPLAASELERLRLVPLAEAARELCTPSSEERFEAARRRAMLEELLRLQARIVARGARRTGRARIVRHDEARERELRALFPFALTDGQRRICAELRRDLARARPMRRLIQGDVGSGKTALGFYACAAVAGSGAQCAFMAPTELLAEQHVAGLRPLCERAGLRAALLTGSVDARERRRVLEELALGRIDVLFGTHALFGAEVRFRELALVVIDEQHRFGVAQRARLQDKGRDVHLLLMTATPIPRTLALTIYGDLDVSVLREKPPGRGAVRTRWMRPKDRERLPHFLAERLAAGEQVYWVAPRIGEEGDDTDDDASDARASGAERAFRRLARSPLAAHGVELVHGRLDAAERARRLERFRRGEARLVVATTLIEVGVDVPAATVMVIEECERLGLAQLHQLRGRVGRSEKDSWCLLEGKPLARERLELLERTCDGFEIAEEDLRRRGMGELLGLRQAGGAALDAGGLEGELDLLVAARDLIRAEPELARRWNETEPAERPVHSP